MSFHGWPEGALDFFRGLETDNSKAYWTAHKADYDAEVLAPMEELLAELAGEFGEPRIFRPYRDVRFSADKSPYKTAIGATLSRGGYVQLSADGLGAGAGYHRLEPDQLARYRDAVAAEKTGEALRATLRGLRAKRIEVISSEALKSAPRGFPKEHPRLDLLIRKDLAAWRQWPPAPWLSTATAKTRVAEFLRSTAALTGWLDAHVGPSTDRRR